MTTTRHRLAVRSLAVAALMGATQLPASPVAHAAPTRPATPVAAPNPTIRNLSLAAGRGTVNVGGHPMRVVASLAPTTAPFTMAAITWQSSTGTPVLQLRTKGASGWSSWRTLTSEGDGVSPSEHHGNRQGTSPIWAESSTAVEARVLASGATPTAITGARVALVDTRTIASDAGLPSAATSAVPTGTVRAASSTGVTYATAPAIISRAQWGADERLLSYNGSGCVNATIDATTLAALVHHTEGSNTYAASDSASIVRGIYAFHVKDRGWCDIGYNFLVDKYGQVFEGRHGGIHNPVHGAHATSWNTNSVGVSVMMDSMTARPTPESMTALSKVIAWKLAGNYRDPLSTLTLAGTQINRIARHGDVMDTDCPGTNITAYMPTLRKQVAAAMGNWKTPIYTQWQALGGESGQLGSPHIMERPWNGGRTTTFRGGAIYQDTSAQTHWMGSAINARYTSNGFSALGWPRSNQTTVSGGVQKVTFEKGSITWSGATGAHATSRAVDAWLAANPTNASRLGLPTAETSGTASNGYQTFQHGSLLFSNGTIKAVMGSGKQGDLDGDGRADVLSVGTNGAVTWYPTTSNGAAGTVHTGDTLTGAPFTWIAQTPDLNGDGMTELLARRSDGTLWAWRGAGRGHYTAPREVGHGWNSMRELNLVPDMDKDGRPEIVAISAQQDLMKYKLDSNLKVVSTLRVGQRWGSIVHLTSVGDFRNVGVTDILGVTADGRLIDYRGSRTGQLSDGPEVGHGWNGFTQLRSLGDMDGDGRWDLAGNRASGPLYSYKNQSGSFGARIAVLSDVSGRGLFA